MSARFIVGDSLAVLRSMPDASVDLVLTSPPFLALRSYLPADHPDKALEMGSEPTPGAYIDALLTIVEECRRVLAPHGSLVWELGDTYAGSGGAGGDYAEGGLRDGQERFKARAGWRDADGWPLDKSLCLIPELLRFALAYGFNPLTGRQTPRWRVRNVVRWCRPNPPVGALGDKVRPATSDMLVACVGRKRYFDLDAVRTPFTGHAGVGTGVRKGQNGAKPEDNRPTDMPTRVNTHAGAPPLDHWWHDEDTFDQDAWLIPTAPYKGAHYATWPVGLLVKPILSMCPQRVCTTCGKPSERITETARVRLHDGAINPPRVPPTREDASNGSTAIGIRHGMGVQSTTTGWTDCGHGTWRPGVVLDPFAGTGTTLAVATGHGRDAIGIDLDERNAELARTRVGMFLGVEDYRAVVA